MFTLFTARDSCCSGPIKTIVVLVVQKWDKGVQTFLLLERYYYSEDVGSRDACKALQISPASSPFLCSHYKLCRPRRVGSLGRWTTGTLNGKLSGHMSLEDGALCRQRGRGGCFVPAEAADPLTALEVAPPPSTSSHFTARALCDGRTHTLEFPGARRSVCPPPSRDGLQNQTLFTATVLARTTQWE